MNEIRVIIREKETNKIAFQNFHVDSIEVVSMRFNGVAYEFYEIRCNEDIDLYDTDQYVASIFIEERGE